MKTITIKVPEGVYKMAQSIALSQDRNIADIAADGLSDIIHSAMGQKASMCDGKETTTSVIDFVPTEKVTLNITPELHRLFAECARIEEEDSVSDWIISSLESVLVMFADQDPVDFTRDEVKRIYES